MYLRRMESILNWLAHHWTEIAAAIGGGSGSGVIVKKMVDKQQDISIKKLEGKVNTLNVDMARLRSDIDMNTAFDKQFREQVEREYNGLKESLSEVKNGVNQILGHLLNSK